MLYNGRVGQSNFLYTFERISVVVAVVEVVVVVVVHSGYSLYGNTRKIPFSMVPDVWWFAPDVFVCVVVNGAPRPTWAALAGPGNHNSEVYRDTINTVNARRDGKHFRIKSALRGKDGITRNWNLSCTSCVWETRGHSIIVGVTLQ